MVFQFVDGVLTPVCGYTFPHEMNAVTSQLKPGTYLTDGDFQRYITLEEDNNREYFGQWSKLGSSTEKKKREYYYPVLPPYHMQLRKMLNRLSYDLDLTTCGKLAPDLVLM